MATEEELTTAVGCLSVVFPQFVANELAALVDEILSAALSFSDPLAAIADLNLDTLIDDVASLSEGDVFNNLGEAAVGLAAQHVRREASGLIDTMSNQFGGITKRVQDVQNLSSRLVALASLMLSVFPDMPYAAGQKICEIVIRLNDLKIANLDCLRKHIVQLVNCVLVLVENVENYVDDTFEDLDDASAQLLIVKRELGLSRRIVDGEIVFDADAFDRARDALIRVNGLLTPDKDGTSVLDVIDILTSGSVEAGQVNRANMALSTLVIPSLIRIIEVEISATVTQIEVINYHISALSNVIGSFRAARKSSQVQDMRIRAITGIEARVNDLCTRIDLARAKRNLTAASAEMLLWSSRVKTIIATMDRIKDNDLQEGSSESDAKALELQQAFNQLLSDIGNISSIDTVAGIEDPLDMRDQVLALTSGARRILKDLETGFATESRMATFHQLSVQVATAQVSRIEQSKNVAIQMQNACRAFTEIDLGIRERYDQLLDGMRQVGLDRGVDLLSVGDFSGFLDSGLDTLSYLGTAIKCLTDALDATDDVQTRNQISAIRDSLIGRLANQDIASVDSSDQGLSRFINGLKGKIASIQKNAKTVESIVTELKSIAAQIGLNLTDAGLGAASFLGNIDHLAVGAGGRLASALEEFSDFANAGVVLCEPL